MFRKIDSKRLSGIMLIFMFKVSFLFFLVSVLFFFVFSIKFIFVSSMFFIFLAFLWIIFVFFLSIVEKYEVDIIGYYKNKNIIKRHLKILFYFNNIIDNNDNQNIKNNIESDMHLYNGKLEKLVMPKKSIVQKLLCKFFKYDEAPFIKDIIV